MFLDHGRDDLGLPTLRLGSEGPNLSFSSEKLSFSDGESECKASQRAQKISPGQNTGSNGMPPPHFTG